MWSILLSLLAIVVSIGALIYSRREHIAERRPYLVFSEEQIEEGKATGFYLRNIGRGTAFNLDIPDKYVDNHDFLKDFSQIPRNVAVDGVTMFARWNGNRRLITKDLYLEVTYEDSEGRKYRTVLDGLKHKIHKE